jgi:hypothetical protein
MVEMGRYMSWMVWLGYVPIFKSHDGHRRPSGQLGRLAALLLVQLSAASGYVYYLYTHPTVERATEYCFKVKN